MISTAKECLVSAAVELDGVTEHLGHVHRLLWAGYPEFADEAERVQGDIDVLMTRLETELAGGGPRLVS